MRWKKLFSPDKLVVQLVWQFETTFVAAPGQATELAFPNLLRRFLHTLCNCVWKCIVSSSLCTTFARPEYCCSLQSCKRREYERVRSVSDLQLGNNKSQTKGVCSPSSSVFVSSAALCQVSQSSHDSICEQLSSYQCEYHSASLQWHSPWHGAGQCSEFDQCVHRGFCSERGKIFSCGLNCCPSFLRCRKMFWLGRRGWGVVDTMGKYYSVTPSQITAANKNFGGAGVHGAPWFFRQCIL